MAMSAYGPNKLLFRLHRPITFLKMHYKRGGRCLALDASPVRTCPFGLELFLFLSSFIFVSMSFVVITML